MNQTINPNEFKPAREWLNYLPEPIKSEAIEACEKWPWKPDDACSFLNCINRAILDYAADNPEKWAKISDQIISGEILPVSPEAEQPKPNTDLASQIAGLRLEFAAMRRQIEQMKAEPTPVTEPKQVKLPVTIQEVWDSESEMKGKKTFYLSNGIIIEDSFDQVKVIDEFRTEKTAKKAIAFLTLLKIAEAQNEVVERGQVVFTGRKAVDEVVSALINPLYGQIYFHSEQGLKDCIAANQQLWKDYLEIGN